MKVCIFQIKAKTLLVEIAVFHGIPCLLHGNKKIILHLLQHISLTLWQLNHVILMLLNKCSKYNVSNISTLVQTQCLVTKCKFTIRDDFCICSINNREKFKYLQLFCFLSIHD